ncbi:iron ABC transporter substrate-binding protein [Paraburkholderia silvatlantica]|uniref:Iron(III) transport system substrate-binding protein n=1 Tax=Paraburkholderia silvatlantica TaxID=321895 RepID=A0A2U1ABT3_9BURK|nr:iron ABC transporter substrate-binding protein [Paraburkholderia silvatlantica]MBB2930384.1 iron(III) transport system substrate-binding protein [Paraburkholderia silvatlantica]PVY32214.1 iron(III) transport system substrate-binding protein [Paraburkholderia silvatlantica]PXW37834.1 iron(III) transport system substrate-binding protein [Paraburkholderia silvatlantica]PYE25655.1 iron(III) transport system substrate-binding protein [Paraburkholderia silvatlantica]TDQ97702.1 iron(III) transport
MKISLMRTPLRAAALSLALSSMLPLAAHAASITLYNAQHEQVANQLAKDFEQQTGIDVKVRSGEGPALAAQLVAEGGKTPADVYFTENSPELMLLEEKGLLAPVQQATLAAVPARFNSPQGQWVGVTARENVLAYNTAKVQPAQLPKSIFDLAKPEWKGKVGIAPSDADFLPLVDAVLAVKGEAATLDWLKGLKTNSQIFDDDEGVVAAVNRGAVATGIINNYYWDRLHAEIGDKKTQSAVAHFADGDVGALVNVSGAAVTKSAHNVDGAQKFLAYLVSERAQKLMAQDHISFEYPLRPGVASDPINKPFDQLKPPALTIQQLGDDSQAGKLLRQAGLL